MISIANLINNIGREILTSLNDRHLKLLTDMICKDVDVATFIIQEGSLLMDSEKEKSVVTRIQSMINRIDGEFYNDKTCDKIEGCVYWKIYDTLMKYLYMENSPLFSKSIKAILEQPYDKEIFDYIEQADALFR